MNRYLVHAQHCDGPFYMGWWLYADPVGPGGARYSKRFVGDGGSLWLREGHQAALAVALAAHHGVTLPAPRRHSDRAAEAFAAAFPLGILVSGEDAGRWSAEGSEVNRDAGLMAGWPYGDEGEGEGGEEGRGS